MNIGVLVAMEKELLQLRTLISDEKTTDTPLFSFYEGSIGKNHIVAAQSGIGKVNAAVAAVEMINRYDVDAIISTGVAGGASVALEIRDVVASTSALYHDVYCGKEAKKGQIIGLPLEFKSDERLLQKARQLQCSVKIHTGKIVTGDCFVDNKAVMQGILDDFPEAMAVDMESAAIAQVCHRYKRGFISFRIISDIPLKDTDASQYYDFWQSLQDGSFEVTRAFLEAL